MLIPKNKLLAEAKRIFLSWKPTYLHHDTRDNFLDYCNMEANRYVLDIYRDAYKNSTLKYWEDQSWVECKHTINDAALEIYADIGANISKQEAKILFYRGLN